MAGPWKWSRVPSKERDFNQADKISCSVSPSPSSPRYSGRIQQAPQQPSLTMQVEAEYFPSVLPLASAIRSAPPALSVNYLGRDVVPLSPAA